MVSGKKAELRGFYEMNDAMADTERLKYVIGGSIIASFLMAGLLAILLSFVCFIFGKKTIGDKLVWFSTLCGAIGFSSALLIVAWIKNSWVPLIMLTVALLIPISLRKKWKQKNELGE